MQTVADRVNQRRIAATAVGFSGPTFGFGSAFAPSVSFSGPTFGLGSAFAPSVSFSCPAAEHGGALAASPAPAAAPRSASSSLSAARAPPLTFTYHDRFLGKAVCNPVVQQLQIAAPLMLVTPALHFARGRAAAGAAPQHPAPPVGCMRVQLWPTQRTRFMFGFTLKACDRASAAPASSHVYFRTASRWNIGILRRVISDYGSKVQVRCRGCCARARGACFADPQLRLNIGLDARKHGSLARCMPPPPPAHPPVFLRLLPPLESLERSAYGMLREWATLHSLEITFSRTTNA